MNDSLDIFGSGEMMTPVSLGVDMESIIPLRDQVLIRPDKAKRETKGGIVLPENIRIPVFRGRVLAISHLLHMQYEQMQIPEMHRVGHGDRVVFHWNSAMLQDTESSESNILVSINNILGKVKPERNNGRVRSAQPSGVS